MVNTHTHKTHKRIQQRHSHPRPPQSSHRTPPLPLCNAFYYYVYSLTFVFVNKFSGLFAGFCANMSICHTLLHVPLGTHWTTHWH